MGHEAEIRWLFRDLKPRPEQLEIPTTVSLDQLISTDIYNSSTFTSSNYNVQPAWPYTISQDLTQIQKRWELPRGT